MPSIARAGLGGSQEPETPSTSAVWMAGTRVPEPHLLSPGLHQQGAGMKAECLGLEPAPECECTTQHSPQPGGS